MRIMTKRYHQNQHLEKTLSYLIMFKFLGGGGGGGCPDTELFSVTRCSFLCNFAKVPSLSLS